MISRLFVLLVFLFFACSSAQLVEKRGQSPYAPINERMGGRVRYMLGGAEFVLRARREDAYKQMFKECNGRYSITREWDETGEQVSSTFGSSYATANVSGTATTNGNTTKWNGSGASAARASALTLTTVQQYRNIEFACEGASAGQAP